MQHDDFSSWAVVSVGNFYYVGNIVDGLDAVGVFGNPFVTLKPAFQVQMHTLPMQVRPGQISMQREISVMPFLTTLKDAPLHVRAEAIQLFSELDPSDKQRYIRLITEAMSLCLELSAKESGLQVAKRLPGEHNA